MIVSDYSISAHFPLHVLKNCILFSLMTYMMYWMISLLDTWFSIFTFQKILNGLVDFYFCTYSFGVDSYKLNYCLKDECILNFNKVENWSPWYLQETPPNSNACTQLFQTPYIITFLTPLFRQLKIKYHCGLNFYFLNYEKVSYFCGKLGIKSRVFALSKLYSQLFYFLQQILIKLPRLGLIL